jgi:uncharacterized protein involved in exopolysaccharide biosynthesis
MPDLIQMHESEYQGAVVDLGGLLALLRARWWLVSVIALVIAALFCAYAFLATPIYRATTVLVPAGGGRDISGNLGSALGQLGGLASLVGTRGLNSEESTTEQAMAIVHSREFLQRFIADNGLLPQMFPGAWDATTQRWRENGRHHPPTIAKGAKKFDKEVLTVVRDRKTGLVTLTVDWRDRNEAAAWAAELVARVNSDMRLRAMNKAAAYKEFLDKELKSTELVEARAAINALIEEQIKERMIASVSQEYAFITVDHAMPPDADDIYSPNKMLVSVAGICGGALAGCFAVIVFCGKRNRPV